MTTEHEHGNWDQGGYCNRLVLDANGDGEVCGYRPAPVVPDTPDLRKVMREAEGALIRATEGDDPTTWAGTPWWHVHRLLLALAAVRLTVTAEFRCDWDNCDGHPHPDNYCSAQRRWPSAVVRPDEQGGA